MPTYLRGRGGSIGGIISQSGATFNGKVGDWRLEAEKNVYDVSGFGDAGNTYYDEGTGKWAFSCNGFVLSGVTLGAAKMSGTTSVAGTIALQADSGKVFYGSVYFPSISVTTSYKGGPVVFTGQGVGNGPLNES